jgi:hypothetical protein
MDTTTKAPIKSRPVSFSPEELQRVIAEAVAAATAQAKAEFAEALAAKPSAANGKSQTSMHNEIAVVKAFRKAGFGTVVPHEDVKTFNRWVAAGYRPIEGSKSLKIKNLRLFHKSQCRPITAEQKQAMQEQSDAAVGRHGAANVHQPNPSQ